MSMWSFKCYGVSWLTLLICLITIDGFSQEYRLYRIRRGFHHSLVLSPNPFKESVQGFVQNENTSFVWIGFGSWRWMLEERKDFLEAFRSVIFPHKGMVVLLPLGLPAGKEVESLIEMSESDRTRIDVFTLNEERFQRVTQYILNACELNIGAGPPLELGRGVTYRSKHIFFWWSNCQTFCNQVIHLAKEN